MDYFDYSLIVKDSVSYQVSAEPMTGDVHYENNGALHWYCQ